MNMVEQMARQIARANGDEFSDAFKNKERWIARRGMSGGRFRDVNEPFQSDYIDMALAALRALQNPTPGMVEAGDDAIIYHPEDIVRNQADRIWSAMVAKAIEEGEAGRG